MSLPTRLTSFVIPTPAVPAGKAAPPSPIDEGLDKPLLKKLAEVLSSCALWEFVLRDREREPVSYTVELI
jgi:hypothetical protein